MRKLLLIQPSKLAGIRSGLYNLAALATYVETECEVHVLDPIHESYEQALRNFAPDIIGITSYTVTYTESIDMMNIARVLIPGALRIIGGVHISCLPQSLDDVFDAGVVGDGEETLMDIIREGTRKNLNRIHGICYRDSAGIKVNPRKPVNTAQLPVPKQGKYLPNSYESGVAAFITSRGCPFRCVFCYSPVMQGTVRNYSVSWIVDQFEYALKTMKADFLMILDDTVCLDIDRLHELADEIERRYLSGFRVAVNIRSSAVDDELCQALQRLNVTHWNCGFESGSDRILNQIKGPSATVDKHYNIVGLAHRYGVTLNGSFIFGMPGETIEDMEETLRFMEYLYNEKTTGCYRGNFWTFCATPLPGTLWWDIATKKGTVSSTMDWTKLDIKKWDNHLLLDDAVSPEQFDDIRRRADELIEKSNRIF